MNFSDPGESTDILRILVDCGNQIADLMPGQFHRLYKSFVPLCKPFQSLVDRHLSSLSHFEIADLLRESQARPGMLAGLARYTLAPAHGLHHSRAGDPTGWQTWCGVRWCDSAEFFQPVWVDYRIVKLPAMAKFLALQSATEFCARVDTSRSGFDEALLRL